MNVSRVESDLIDSNLLFQRLDTLSKRHRITKWDLGASCSSDSSVQVDKGIAKQLKSSQRNSLTLRVWNLEGTVGITSTTDFSEKGLLRALEAAFTASEFGNQTEIPSFSPQAKFTLPELNRDLKEPIGIMKLLDMLKYAEKRLLSFHKSIDSVPYNGLSESKYKRIYINSEGANRQIERTQASLYLYSRAQENKKKPRSSGAIKLALGANEIDIDSCIEESAQKTINHLNYKPIETGKYLVCFKPEAILELINSFSSIFNARSILDGISLSSKKSLGEQISVPCFNLTDNGLHKDNIGAVTFDGEGTPTQKIQLVEDGIIKNFIHSEATARAFNVNPTGHAGLGAKVSVGPDWFVIDKSPGSPSPLNHLNNRDSFVMIENLSALHAGVKSSQGSFSLPFDGWIFNDGEPISIEAATVAGDIKQVLNSIVCIESDSYITHIGLSPHVWVEDLSITGEA